MHDSTPPLPSSVCARDVCQVYLRLANPAISNAGIGAGRRASADIDRLILQDGDTGEASKTYFVGHNFLEHCEPFS